MAIIEEIVEEDIHVQEVPQEAPVEEAETSIKPREDNVASPMNFGTALEQGEEFGDPELRERFGALYKKMVATHYEFRVALEEVGKVDKNYRPLEASENETKLTQQMKAIHAFLRTHFDEKIDAMWDIIYNCIKEGKPIDFIYSNDEFTKHADQVRSAIWGTRQCEPFTELPEPTQHSMLLKVDSLFCEFCAVFFRVNGLIEDVQDGV